MGRDHEPSMDEILASIKRIIAEEDSVRPTARRGVAPVRARVIETPAQQPDVMPDVLELTEDAELAEPAEAADDGEEPLIDNSTAESLRHSLSALATLTEPGVQPQIVRSGETSLEGLVRDMLRPMLKDWLDSNLPTIVERAIAKEIGRITKGH